MTEIEFVIDCGPASGMGHYSRALVLARALAERGAACQFFVTTEMCREQSTEFPTLLLNERGPNAADVTIVDGLNFSAEDLAAERARASCLAVVDDLAYRRFQADLVINQNIYAETLDYSFCPPGRLLLGLRYALIRPEFGVLRETNERREPRALLTFGGGKTAVVAFDVARALARRFVGPIDIAMGMYVSAEGQTVPQNVALHRGADMPALMARATLYVGALGVTYLEALAAGLPVVGAVVADNQRMVAGPARRLGATVFERPDAAGLADAATRLLTAAPGPDFPDQPDGGGAARIAEIILELAQEKS